MSIYSLYWIRDPKHTDPFSEGYIGITKRNPKQRFQEHIIRRGYTDKELVVLCIGSEEYISELESKLRPESWIGWNNAPGGLTGGRPTGIRTSGWKHSAESRGVRSERMTGERNPMYGKPTSSKQKEAVRKAHKGTKKPYVSRSIKKLHAEGRAYKFNEDDIAKAVAARRPRKWYTNGTDNVSVCEGDPVPEGYRRGRTIAWKK